MSADEAESEQSSGGSCVSGDGGAGSSSSSTTVVPADAGSSSNRQDMYDTFKTWALQNYGDSGKTKTVTRKKYERIVNILTGDEPPTSENSKFRFWVKAKGFCLGPLPADDEDNEGGSGKEEGRGPADSSDGQVLYVPTKITGSPCARDDERSFKRVAVVEDFFDIIYDVHVEMDGRGGKHAGQKRTYRAIAETYAFLPREAVTRFLMSCSDCQKRMHLSMETNNNNHNTAAPTGSAGTTSSPGTSDPPIIDFSVPITTTYLNHMRGKGKVDSSFILHHDKEDSMSSAESDLSREGSPSPAGEEPLSPRPPDLKQEATSMSDSRSSTPNNTRTKTVDGAEIDQPVNLIDRNGNTDHKIYNMSNNKDSDHHVTEVSRGHPERKRRASDESSTRASESGLGEEMCGAKDEEGDDEEDDEEKLPAPGMDPERLKAFNMFVRLFVDENLDRMVPISKQPKDKIQAILEACDRQFPEFHERSRKRIRTYLKSCRRMRRSKEANGWEPLRPTPPHLTSAAAESILAQACENESNNAKRMRMGLEPIANNYSNPPSSTSCGNQSKPPTPQPPPANAHHTNQPATTQASTAQPPPPPPLERQPSLPDYMRHPPAHAFRPPHEIPSPFFTNSNGIFRPGFPSSYQHPAHQHPPTVIQHTPLNNQISNGPTDLSMKKSGSSSKNQLNPSEVATIKQLIAGYRESAAFLYRSADELEQLLLQQN